jgi:hypothetical protein
MVKAQSSSSAKRSGRRMRADPIPDWLGFIRPQLHSYQRLPWGGQQAFIKKLSQRTGSSENTLRRFIAAAEFLEGYGITTLAAGRRPLPIAAVEVIGRISKKDPARGRMLLDKFMNGVGTIQILKDELANMAKGKPSWQGKPATPVSATDVNKAITGLARSLGPGVESLLPFYQEDWRFLKFSAWPGPAGIFAKAAWPAFVMPLYQGRYAVIFDEATLAWAASPATVTREFIRNIAIAVAMFDFVLVLCNVLQADVTRAIEAMRDECRGRIRVLPGTLPT